MNHGRVFLDISRKKDLSIKSVCMSDMSDKRKRGALAENSRYNFNYSRSLEY